MRASRSRAARERNRAPHAERPIQVSFVPKTDVAADQVIRRGYAGRETQDLTALVSLAEQVSVAFCLARRSRVFVWRIRLGSQHLPRSHRAAIGHPRG